MTGVEPVTSSLPRKRSTPELHRQFHQKRAGDEIRTRDPQLGRLMLYQLSYSRIIQTLWARMDLNHRRLTSTDLQSVAFDRSATDPTHCEPLEGFEPPTR